MGKCPPPMWDKALVKSFPLEEAFIIENVLGTSQNDGLLPPPARASREFFFTLRHKKQMESPGKSGEHCKTGLSKFLTLKLAHTQPSSNCSKSPYKGSYQFMAPAASALGRPISAANLCIHTMENLYSHHGESLYPHHGESLYSHHRSRSQASSSPCHLGSLTSTRKSVFFFFGFVSFFLVKHRFDNFQALYTLDLKPDEYLYNPEKVDFSESISPCMTWR